MYAAIKTRFQKFGESHPRAAYIAASVFMPAGLAAAVGALTCCAVLPVSWALGLL